MRSGLEPASHYTTQVISMVFNLSTFRDLSPPPVGLRHLQVKMHLYGVAFGSMLPALPGEWRIAFRTY